MRKRGLSTFRESKKRVWRPRKGARSRSHTCTKGFGEKKEGDGRSSSCWGVFHEEEGRRIEPRRNPDLSWGHYALPSLQKISSSKFKTRTPLELNRLEYSPRPTTTQLRWQCHTTHSPTYPEKGTIASYTLRQVHVSRTTRRSSKAEEGEKSGADLRRDR